MNFYKIGLGVFTAILSFSAVAEGGGDRTFALMMERNEKAMAAYAAKKRGCRHPRYRPTAMV